MGKTTVLTNLEGWMIMKIKKITFYKRNWIANVRDIKKLCSIEFHNGIVFNDISLVEKEDGSLYIRFPSRCSCDKNGNKQYNRIFCCSDKLFQKIKEAVIDQWHRYTSHWKADDVIA